MTDNARGAGRYEGTAGESYFAWQSEIGALGGQLDTWKFEPYVRATDVVADFGCGGGFILANLTCAERVGIEMNPAARTHAASLGVEVHADSADIAENRVDLVISNHALEHVTAPFDVLRQLHRIVKPGGKAVFVVPYEGWLRPDRYAPGNIDQHLYAWTPLLLGNLFAAAGFEVEKSEVLWSAWTPAAWERWRRSLFLYRVVCRYLSVRLNSPQLRIIARKP